MQRLLDNDIEIHAQIVLCPEINDGAVLQKTVRGFKRPFSQNFKRSIVPLGLTRYNTDSRLTAVHLNFVAVQSQKLNAPTRISAKFGETFAFLGDEIYIKLTCPSQLANIPGIIRKSKMESVWYELLRINLRICGGN
jgi:NifB/MoaA-like Fe-S oxidoreductase